MCPDDWIPLILEANTQHPSIIQKMNLEDFKRMSDLEPYYRLPPSLKIPQVKWIRLERD